jgi:hypothetical protein
MAINSFIPTVWTAKLLQTLEKSLVYGQAGVVNRDYEGEISDAGDTVRINSLGPVSVGSYTKNSTISAAEVLNDASQVLTIEYADYFNFKVDDIDKAQQRPKVMGQAMSNAAYALADAADQIIAGLMWQSVPTASTQGTTSAAVTLGYGTGETSPYVALITAGQNLDEHNVPRAGRFALVPPWFHAYLMLDPRFVATGAPAADTRAVNGFMGRAAGFDIAVSNNCPNVTGAFYKIVCGTNMATSFAEQIAQVEAYRPQDSFSDALKGLHLYGCKVVYPEALALIIATAGDAE